MDEIKLKFDYELSIFNVDIYWKKLIEVLEKISGDGYLILDFSDLEKIDGAGIQLLLSLEKTILKDKLKIKYINISDEIAKIFKTVGVEYLLVMKGESYE